MAGAAPSIPMPATLLDTHWIGGDPLQLQVYGWASWSPAKGLPTLRNPSDKPQDFTIDLASAFELPPGAAKAYILKSVWSGTPSPLDSKLLRAGDKQVIHLAAFQVVTFEALPANQS